ncbi:DNA replication complex GINS protein Psf1p [Trichomonascus vanleenenianus]|uniref:DNA replication protein PSF1 n=1 Tax=Trichomonascus vanleenenianus TaxID=2268995 RepID=UPI003EC9B215
MYGDLANKLIQDARRTQNLESLPLYQEELVRAIARETRELHRETERIRDSFEDEELATQDRKTSCALFVLHLCMRRNKRCLLAYQRLRAEKMVEMVWNEQVDQDNEAVSNLSPNEQEYLHKYSDLLVDYKGEWTDIDLTGSVEPPRDLFVDVRVLKDAGEIQTEYGVFNLTKNSQFFVRQADVQRLIQQGYLQKL